jgi:hypothetical protein
VRHLQVVSIYVTNLINKETSLKKHVPEAPCAIINIWFSVVRFENIFHLCSFLNSLKKHSSTINTISKTCSTPQSWFNLHNANKGIALTSKGEASPKAEQGKLQETR